MTRLPIVGVMGSSNDTYAARTHELGAWLARQDVHLLTGAGAGVMAAVSEAFHDVAGRRGRVIGIVPGESGESGYEAKSGYPNPWVEIPIFTHLPLTGIQGSALMSRNHINILTSDVIVALPGGAGTASEVTLAVRYGKPLIAWFDRREDIPGLPAEVSLATDFDAVQAFVRTEIEQD